MNQKTFLEKQKTRAMKAMDKLLDAYQEGLIAIGQLRKRMPELQRKVNETTKQLQEIHAHEITLGKQLELLDITTFTKQMEDNLEDLGIELGYLHPWQYFSKVAYFEILTVY